MASSKKDIMIPMHEGVGAIPTVVLNKLLLPVKISTGFLSFSPAVIVASSFPKMTTFRLLQSDFFISATSARSSDG